MISLELHCPTCHHKSGNAITVDWPEPLEPQAYFPLLCKECGRNFSFAADGVNGMRCWTTTRTTQLADFLERRKRNQRA
jgi:hypothetical protein